MVGHKGTDSKEREEKMRTKTGVGVLALAVLAVVGPLSDAAAQRAKTPEQMTPAELRAFLAKNPEIFLKSARTALKWDEAAEPVKIAGPIYFVGTKGLSAWLITGSEGNILLNTCMPESGPMIEASIRKLGFDPKRIKWLLTGHSHVDHVGGHAYLKTLTGAQVAVSEKEVALLESGGKGQFNYDGVPGLDYPAVKVDRALRDGDVVRLGDIALTAHLTAGHNVGSMTWTMNVVDGGKTLSVVFPDVPASIRATGSSRTVLHRHRAGLSEHPALPGDAEARHLAPLTYRHDGFRGQARAGCRRGHARLGGS